LAESQLVGVAAPGAGERRVSFLRLGSRDQQQFIGAHDEFVGGQQYVDSFNAVAVDGTVKTLNVEAGGQFAVSDAATMLTQAQSA